MNKVNGQPVVKKEQAEEVAVTYKPRPFPFRFSKPAVDFVQYQQEKGAETTFRIDRIVAQQTGIAELEKLSIEERIDREALTRLQEIKEQSYQQAYQLGLQEGRDKAYKETMAELSTRMGDLNGLIQSIKQLKSTLINFNEGHIVRLVFYMAKRIALDHIESTDGVVMKALTQAVEEAQIEEKMTVQVSPNDFQFIQKSLESFEKEFEFIKAAKFESAADVTPGGCRIVTNYGEIDATVEQRIERLWGTIAEKLPKTESRIEPSEES